MVNQLDMFIYAGDVKADEGFLQRTALLEERHRKLEGRLISRER